VLFATLNLYKRSEDRKDKDVVDTREVSLCHKVTFFYGKSALKVSLVVSTADLRQKVNNSEVSHLIRNKNDRSKLKLKLLVIFLCLNTELSAELTVKLSAKLSVIQVTLSMKSMSLKLKSASLNLSSSASASELLMLSKPLTVLMSLKMLMLMLMLMLSSSASKSLTLSKLLIGLMVLKMLMLSMTHRCLKVQVNAYLSAKQVTILVHCLSPTILMLLSITLTLVLILSKFFSYVNIVTKAKGSPKYEVIFAVIIFVRVRFNVLYNSITHKKSITTIGNVSLLAKLPSAGTLRTPRNNTTKVIVFSDVYRLTGKPNLDILISMSTNMLVRDALYQKYSKWCNPTYKPTYFAKLTLWIPGLILLSGDIEKNPGPHTDANLSSATGDPRKKWLFR